MKDGSMTPDPREALVLKIRDRAENLFHSRQLHCAESVLVAINQGLNGDLSRAQAVAVASGFPVGVGGSGCLCGALSGGILALGLFLGKSESYLHRRAVRNAAAELHERFRKEFGSACCKVLIRHVKDDPKEHFSHCGGLTGTAAEMTVRMILEKRPELVRQADEGFLNRRATRTSVFIANLLRRFR